MESAPIVQVSRPHGLELSCPGLLTAHDREAQRGIGELSMLSVSPPAGKEHRLDWRDAIRSDDAPQAPAYALSHVGPARRRVSHSLQLGLKRILDVALSCALVIVLAPLLLLVAVAIKLDSQGPIFY